MPSASWSMGRSLCLHPVPGPLHARALGAVRAAEDPVAGLDAVPDDLAAAVVADRRHGVDRAFEAVEHVRLAAARDLHRLVVLVPADLALRHPLLLRWVSSSAYPGPAGSALAIPPLRLDVRRGGRLRRRLGRRGLRCWRRLLRRRLLRRGRRLLL